MRTIEEKIYKFSELSQEVQAKVIEKNRYFNVYHPWYRFVYGDFIEDCKEIGVEVEPKSVEFRLDFSQGDGSKFKAYIDVPKAIEKNGIEIDSRVLKLVLDNRKLNFGASIESHPGRYYGVRLDTESYYKDYIRSEGKPPRIEGEIDKLCEALEQLAQDLNNKFFKMLKEEYEFLTSDEEVKTSLVENGYEFYENGDIYLT